MDVKECCKDDACTVNVDWEALVNDENLAVCARLNLFIDAVEADGRLEIVNTTIEDEVEKFVIQDTSQNDIQILVPIHEVIEKCKSKKSAEKICTYIKGEKRYGTNVCDGVTRVVGFYVHIREFNRSKKGELYDRIKGSYGISNGRSDEHRADALKYVDGCPR